MRGLGLEAMNRLTRAQAEASINAIMAALPGTQVDICRKTKITPSTVRKWVERLETSGAVYISKLVPHPVQGPRLRYYTVRDAGQVSMAFSPINHCKDDDQDQVKSISLPMEEWLPTAKSWRHPMDEAFFGPAGGKTIIRMHIK